MNRGEENITVLGPWLQDALPPYRGLSKGAEDVERLVVDPKLRPLMPCRPARARLLLKTGRAAVLRRVPFTLVLKAARPEARVSPLRVKIDPGAKTTGMAVLNDGTGEVTWVRRLSRWCPVGAISFELVRFDMQLLQNPEITNLEYQRGTLFGTELRQYLLTKWGHHCAYCLATGVPLEIDHILPQSRGGSDRIANLVICCHTCNQAKGNQSLEDFLSDRPEVLARVQESRKTPLKDAAVVNSTRLALYERLKATGLPVEIGSGGLTKWNRSTRGLPKEHWVDAACCGASTPARLQLKQVYPWLITASGRQCRQMRNVDKRGFPVGKPKGPSRVRGFRTGDLVKAVCPSHLKAAGTHVGRVLVRTREIFDVVTRHGRVKDIPARCCQNLHQKDGYAYQLGAALPPQR